MSNQTSQKTIDDHRADYARFSIYTGIGVLAAGGLLLVTFVLTGATGDVIFRAILTLGLLTGFAFATLAENYVSLVRAGWLTVTRISILFATLAAGIWHIWAPIDLEGAAGNYYVSGSDFIIRTFLFILTVGVLQLAALGFTILEKRIRTKRVSEGFLKVLGAGIFAFAVAMFMMAIGFTFPHYFFELELYWRIVSALCIASAVLIVITLLSRALNPAPSVPAPPVHLANPAGWYPTQDPAVERFWNGSAWTDYSRPTGVDDEQPPTGEGRNN